ncbi:hypothetical protein TcG_12767, partial [Trypanosoma cruzi]
PPCRQHNSKGNRSASCWCCSWSTAATLHSPPCCSVGTITRATARCHQNTRAVRRPTRTAQLRPAGAAGSKAQSRLFRPAVPMALGVALARLLGRCAMQPHCNACR